MTVPPNANEVDNAEREAARLCYRNQQTDSDGTRESLLAPQRRVVERKGVQEARESACVRCAAPSRCERATSTDHSASRGLAGGVRAVVFSGGFDIVSHGSTHLHLTVPVFDVRDGAGHASYRRTYRVKARPRRADPYGLRVRLVAGPCSESTCALRGQGCAAGRRGAGEKSNVQNCGAV